MISKEVMKFLGLLNELAKKSKEGVIPLSECKSNKEIGRFIVYDDDDTFKQNYRGVVVYPIVLETDIGADWCKYYDDGINVVIDGGASCIVIDKDDFTISITDGEWVVID